VLQPACGLVQNETTTEEGFRQQMAFFKKDLDETAAEAALTHPGEVRSPSAAPARTYVAPGSHIDGSIAGEAEVLVDGSLTGNVELKGRFVLGRRGRIEADVVAQSVQVSGHVKGDIRASEKIEVLSSGSVEGDLTAPLVSIAEGGICNGRIEMSGTLAIGATPSRSYGSAAGGPGDS
jgi:cytoskeletal protein CcmA (bactofilin family)